MIYLDNAATSLHKPKGVIEEMVKAMDRMGNAGRGSHEGTLEASRMIFRTRKKLADLFGAEDPSRIAFTCNGTESLNIAIKGCLKPGDHVITTQMEHNSVLRPLYEMEERGVELTILPCDREGRLDVGDFEREIRENTRLMICTHGSNLTGNLVDIAAIGKIAHDHGILFCVDASQTAGVFPIDVKKMNIDILCFTGHKGLLGPQGTGGIYVSSTTILSPLKTGGSGIMTYSKKHPDQMPTALEAGTLNGHGIAGLGAALDFLKETGIDQIRKREQQLTREFYKGVSQLPKVKVYGDFSSFDRCPIVSLNIGDYDSGLVGDELAVSYGIATRSGGHCAPLMHQALGTKNQGAVRFSFSYFNREDEVAMAISAVEQLSKTSISA